MHFKSVIAAVMVVCAGVLVVAQGKVATPEELDKTMKALGQANQAAGKAITSGDFAEGTKQLAIVKKALDDSREFWVMHKKDDAIAANKETVAKLEEVQKMLTGPSPDGQAIMAAMKQSVGAACRMCHEKYRVRDAENNWVLKPGSIGGEAALRAAGSGFRVRFKVQGSGLGSGFRVHSPEFFDSETDTAKCVEPAPDPEPGTVNREPNPDP